MNVTRAASILILSHFIGIGGVAADSPQTPPTSQPTSATSRPAAPFTPADAGSRGILAGPRVEAEAIGRDEGRPRRQQAQRRPTIPPRRWMALVRELDLDPRQGREVRKIVEQMSRERRAFQRQHGEEFSKLGRRVREAAAGAPVPTEAERERLQELRAKQPAIERHQNAIWALLTPSQQQQMRKAIERTRQQIDARKKEGVKKEGVKKEGVKKEEEQVDTKLDETTRRRLKFLRKRRAK